MITNCIGIDPYDKRDFLNKGKVIARIISKKETDLSMKNCVAIYTSTPTKSKKD